MAEFIVAIELGSSKVTGVAGKKNLDGSINVLAVVKEDASSFIRKGVVNNIDKTAICITNIVNKLTNQLKVEITKVYVGVGGQSIHSVRNVISKDLPADTKVTQQMVIDLMDSNRSLRYPDQEIIDVAVQEYKVDTQLQIDPVGIQCSRLEGTFLNILQRMKFYKNLNACFDAAGIPVAEFYLAPLALADSVLSEAERRSGCVLVDIGYDTTTVSVYYKNILRHLAVIPLGSNNITKDIASLQMEEADAEKMKLKYASAYTDNSEIDDTLMLPIDATHSVESRKFIEVVEGRLEEIIENVWRQVPPEYCDKLLGGIILTGGGANMKNMEVAFGNRTHVEKIRTAKFVTHTINSTHADITTKNGMMNTVLGILAKGDTNCAGSEIDPNRDLFSGNGSKDAEASQRRQPRNPAEIPSGVVRSEAERLQAEEEARRRKEEEEARRKEEEEVRRRKEEEERRKNTPLKKFMRWTHKVVDKLTEPE